MKERYDAQKSAIFDYLYFPILALIDENFIELDMSPAERAILEDIWPLMEQMQLALQPFKETIATTYLLESSGLSFPISLYLSLLQNRKNPKSIKEYLDHISQLEEKDVIDALIVSLTGETSQDRKDDFDALAYIEASDAKAEEKWYRYQALIRPLKTRDRLVSFFENLIPIYQPYFEQFQMERETFAKRLDTKMLFQDTSPRFDYFTSQNMAFQEDINLIILSPWHIRIMTYDVSDNYPNISPFLFVSTRMDQIMMARKSLDDDNLVTILKTISDTTRYAVLKEMILPYAKNKDVATKLGITNAAVSFHIQKLLNSQLLILSPEGSVSKYQFNQDLLNDMLTKLQDDFQKKSD